MVPNDRLCLKDLNGIETILRNKMRELGKREVDENFQDCEKRGK